MPQYKVLKQGFYNGKLYDPNGKRPVLDTDKPFTKKNPMPSWLGEMPKESAEVKKAREAAEKAAALLEAAKNKESKEELAKASSEGNGNETSFLTPDESSDTVETL